jgi:ketosteroid isomerase-like protein
MSDIDTMALEQVLVGIGDWEIVNLEARIRAAQLSADIAALNELISEDLLFTGPDGQLGTKAQDIEAYRSGIVKFLAHVPQELRVRRVGATVAISSLRAQLTVDVAGNISRGIYRYTRVWAHEDDKPWRVVGGHVSLVNTLDSKESGQHETTS